jgi:hypothetical protein
MNGRRGMAERRTGAGLKQGWEPSPALVAQRLARMQGAQRQAAATRADALRRLAEDASGMTLDELRRAIPTRYWTVAVAHLGGYDDVTIARSLGYATSGVVARVLRHPAVRALIEKIQQAQLQRVLEGTYGVQAQAKAAAPHVMEHVVSLAGGKKGADGERIGRARRDSDALRAAELTLTVSGDKREQVAALHVHIFNQMTDDELERLATDFEWPERFAQMQLPGPGASTTSAPPVAATVHGAPATPGGRPRLAGGRRR